MTPDPEPKSPPAEHDLRAARKALRLTQERLRDAESRLQLLDEFLATLSHDLRAPLSSILGWAHLMRIRPPTSEELAKGLEIVERNARIQTQLIEDLLDMRRISSGKPRLERHPAMPAAPVDAEPETDTVFQPVDLRGVRLLVVDDEADACELVERVLEECGAWVVTATVGERALAMLAEHRPDVIISDIGMPDMDGYELLRRMRSLDDAALQRIPAIAMTAFARPEDRSRALGSGFQVHIAKPLEPSQLVATVASVTGRTSVRV